LPGFCKKPEAGKTGTNTPASANPTARRQSETISQRRTTMKEQLIIFDTTMRDGEQSPGA